MERCWFGDTAILAVLARFLQNKKEVAVKTKLKKIGICFVLLVTAASCTTHKGFEKSGRLPSDAAADYLNLERIFSSDEFDPERFGPARWLEDGSGYTTLEDSEAETGGKDIVWYDPKTGSREIMVPSTRLIPNSESKPLKIDDYSWSPDGKKLLIFTNTKRVWRRNTRGDYWVLDMTSWELQKLGGDAEPSTLMFAKFSPNGRRVAYVRERNLYVQNLKNLRIKQLTKDGSDTIINGTSDWVYEEEFGLRDGFRWSPDGKSIAYWQFDTEGVREFYLINNTDSLYPKLTAFQYPKVGETNSACRVGVISSRGGQAKWLKVPGDSRNNYIPKMEWAANSKKTVVFQHLNRLQNTNEVMLGNIRNGRIRKILTERDEAWVDVGDSLRWLNNGKSFTWLSERDGWRHLYLVSRSGKKITLLTPGQFDVISVQSIDEERGWVYYIASPDNPTQRYLYRVGLDGSGKAERLTPADQEGTHEYQVSKDSKWAFHTYSSFGTPPIIELISLPEHRTKKVLVDNSELRSKLDELKRTPVEFFRVDIGNGVQIIKRWPYVDPTRIGIWGWSGGGSMSLNAIFRYPDLYHTAMAIAFISNQRFYDTIYQERYMGLPDDNEEGYKNGSPITYAHQLKGNLLIVHGTGDDNCHYQSCEALINELIKHNKSFSMMAYPNRTHSIKEGENTRRHLYELLTGYLKENLPAGPTRASQRFAE